MAKTLKIAVLASISKSQYFINQAYTDYVENAGMFPVLITPNMKPEVAVAMCDGVIMPGGIDLDPIYYGADNRSSYSVDPVKDEFERGMFHAFREAGKPIFGICRGFQLIINEYLLQNVDLYEFLDFWSDIPQHNQTGSLSLSRNIHSHYVDVVPHFLYGDTDKSIDRIPVNSMHHQCLYADFVRKGIIGTKNFKMAAWTTRGLKIDQKELKAGRTYPVICEAFRIMGWGAPILAVQWHPEELNDTDLIRNFFIENRPVDRRITRAAASE